MIDFDFLVGGFLGPEGASFTWGFTFDGLSDFFYSILMSWFWGFPTT